MRCYTSVSDDAVVVVLDVLDLGCTLGAQDALASISVAIILVMDVLPKFALRVMRTKIGALLLVRDVVVDVAFDVLLAALAEAWVTATAEIAGKSPVLAEAAGWVVCAAALALGVPSFGKLVLVAGAESEVVDRRVIVDLAVRPDPDHTPSGRLSVLKPIGAVESIESALVEAALPSMILHLKREASDLV